MTQKLQHKQQKKHKQQQKLAITVLGDELQAKLERLRNDPESLSDDIEKVEQDLRYLDSLHQKIIILE